MGNGFVKEFDTSSSNPQSACEADFKPLCKDFCGGPAWWSINTDCPHLKCIQWYP